MSTRAWLRPSVAVIFYIIGMWPMAGSRMALSLDSWKIALPGRRLSFPKDHGNHPEYKIEWWYFTGNLISNSGDRFGYQLTFFRVGVNPSPSNPSRWAIRDLFMAHFAVTDVSGNRYRYFERINRAGIGWAGATSDRYRVWNQDWEAGLGEDGQHHLVAKEGEVSIDLRLDPGKLPVLHGENGYSRKGNRPGNASYYYSLTRMPTSGRLSFEGRQFDVNGLSWMDHEFGTSFLEENQTGWDWFSLQFENGTELMLFQLRKLDGRTDIHSSGTWVEAAGRAIPIRNGQFEMKAGSSWQSRQNGARYPIEWEIQIPSLKLKVKVRAAILNQELRTKDSTGVNYWEGAVTAEGDWAGKTVKGRGYLEMTGYGGQVMSRLFQ